MEERLIALYQDMKQISERLNLSTYPTDIARLKKRYADLLEDLRLYLEDPDKPLSKLASCVAESAAQEMAQIASKRKREMARIDYNMTMVSYFLPLIRDIESPRAKELAQGMADAWNEAFPGSHITSMTIADVKGGFRSSPCFITTAVCKSLGKPDDCYELTLLREYRDTYMAQTDERTAAVAKYYRVAPKIVAKIDARADAQAVYASIWEDYLAFCIRLIEENRLDECETVYSDMVHFLEGQYL